MRCNSPRHSGCALKTKEHDRPSNALGCKKYAVRGTREEFKTDSFFFFFNHVAFASLRHVNTDSGATQIDDLDAGRPPVDGSSGLRFLMHAGRRYDRGVGSLMTHNEMLSSHSMMLR